MKEKPIPPTPQDEVQPVQPQEQSTPRGLSAIIEQLERENKIYDPLLGKTYVLDDKGKIASVETDR